MLTAEQQKIVDAAPDTLITTIETFDIRTREAAYRLLDDLSRLCPSCGIHYLGSTKLGIDGSNKTDIVIVAHDKLMEVGEGLEALFGLTKPGDYYTDEMKWETSRNGFPIIIRLIPEADKKLNEHLDIQRILEARGDLRQEYAQLKNQSRGKPLKEYLQKKFEFLNAVLQP